MQECAIKKLRSDSSGKVPIFSDVLAISVKEGNGVVDIAILGLEKGHDEVAALHLSGLDFLIHMDVLVI